MQLPSPSQLINSLVPLTSIWKRLDLQSPTTITIGSNFALDVKDNYLGNGGSLQLWEKHGGVNQLWQYKSGALVVGNNLCLDVPDGKAFDGSRVQIWQCSYGPNQQWKVSGSSKQIQYGQTKYCLDVKDGHIWNGGAIQLWTCNSANTNQLFITSSATGSGQIQQSTSNTGNTGAGSFYGMNVISFDDMCNKFPAVSKYKQVFIDAGNNQRIHPSFLAAIAMQESGVSSPPNGYGCMQFSDDNAWKQFGNGGNKNNIVDSIWAGSRYFRYLIDHYDSNLYNAVQNYCGWLGPYWNDICTWTAGYTPASHQRRSQVFDTITDTHSDKDARKLSDAQIKKGRETHKKGKRKHDHSSEKHEHYL